MPNPFYTQIKKSFNGDPQQIVQNMINSGKISQSQVNQCAQKANQLYEQLKPFM